MAGEQATLTATPSTAAPVESPASEPSPSTASDPTPAQTGSTSESEAQDAPTTPAFDPGILKGLPAEQRAAVLKAFDLDEMFSLDDRLAGKAGKDAQRLARKLLEDEKPRLEQQWEAARVDRERVDRLVRAASEDDAYEALSLVKAEAKRVQDLQAQSTTSARDQAVLHAAVTEWDQALTTAFYELPHAVQVTLGGKDYGATVQARVDFQKDMAHELAKHQAGEIVAKATVGLKGELRKEMASAIRAEVLAELGQSEPNPERGGGGGASGAAITSTTYAANKHNPDWIRSNRAAIGVWLAAGQP
jgi:hypothetical protein